MNSLATEEMMDYTDGVVISVASFLAPRDMVSLALTCKRFGARYGVTSSREARRLAREAKRENTKSNKWSLMEETARQLLDSEASGPERVALPRRGAESWMGVYHELQLLRAPRKFDQLLGRTMYHCFGGSKKQYARARHIEDCNVGAAISQHVMRAGKHCISFYINEGGQGIISVGIMRPIEDLSLISFQKFDPTELDLSSVSREQNRVQRSEDDDDCSEGSETPNFDCCMLATRTGYNMYRDWNDELPRFSVWEGMTSYPALSGTELLFLGLDLDNGILQVFRNDKFVGERTGLSGEYCWVASLLPSRSERSNPTVCLAPIQMNNSSNNYVWG